MAKRRMIDTRFWSDNFISELNPLDRYLFLYFLTNEHTNISGIYEVPLKRVADETGIEKDMLVKMMKRLKGKIEYIDGWVAIKNFSKYQSDNESVRKGVENAKTLIPSRILKRVDTLLQGGGTLGGESDISELESESKLKPELEPKEAEQSSGNEVGEYIKLFGGINPSYGELFKRKPQRAAAERLLKLHPFSWWSEFMTAYVGVLEDRFCPRATTPAQMEDKFAAIMAYGRQRKAEGIKNKQKIWV